MTEAGKHTPTPWELGPVVSSENHMVYQQIFGTGRALSSVSVYGRKRDFTCGGKPLKGGGHQRSISEDEAKANAEFIVKAVNAFASQALLIESLTKALEKAEQFITNGVELGFIRMPDVTTPDSAHFTLPAIRTALASQRAKEQL